MRKCSYFRLITIPVMEEDDGELAQVETMVVLGLFRATGDLEGIMTRRNPVWLHVDLEHHNN